MLVKDYVDAAEKINGLEANRKYAYKLLVGFLIGLIVSFLMGV